MYLLSLQSTWNNTYKIYTSRINVVDNMHPNHLALQYVSSPAGPSCHLALSTQERSQRHLYHIQRILRQPASHGTAASVRGRLPVSIKLGHVCLFNCLSKPTRKTDQPAINAAGPGGDAYIVVTYTSYVIPGPGHSLTDAAPTVPSIRSRAM